MQYIKIGKYRWYYLKCVRNLLILSVGIGAYILFIKMFLDALYFELGL